MNDEVDGFLRALEHPLKKEIQSARELVLSALPGITEQIKWNAPSFCYRGEDRVTFKLYPPKALQLVFHRGATTKDSRGFRFEDPTGLIKWAAPDRGVVTFSDAKALTGAERALRSLVARWMKATASSPDRTPTARRKSPSPPPKRKRTTQK